MAYPVLAPNSSWFTQGGTTVKRASITEIEILDSYTPDSSVTVASQWDASSVQDGSVMCYVIGTKLIIAGNGSGKIAANEDSAQLFCDAAYKDCFTKVVNIIGANTLDVSNATTLMDAFFQMNALVSIDVSNWDTSSVTSINSCFCNCKALTSVDVSNWNVSNVTDMRYAFQGSAIATLDLSGWDVRKVQDVGFMFRNCGALQYIAVSNWKTESLIYMREIFRACSSLIEVDVSKWDVSKVTEMIGIFQNCESLTSLDLSLWDVRSANSMASMFSVCESLQSLGDVSNWNTSACASMYLMFNYCTKLQNLDVSKWNTSAVTDMTFMFYQCPSLGEIDVANWDVSNVTIMDHFAAHSNLRRKGIENWKTSALVNANALFHNCAEEELDLSGWDVSKVRFFCQMFENSPNLKRIKGLEKWDTSAGVGFDGMFERCSKLEEVDLSNFNTTKAKNNVAASDNGHKTATLQNMFFSCNNLKKVKLGPNFSINGDGTNTTAGNKLVLPTPSTDYITGADGNWYAFNGDPYAPNAIPDKTAETYFASFPLCQNEDVIVKNGSLIDVAKAIKEKNGATAKYTPAQFGAAIRAL